MNLQKYKEQNYDTFLFSDFLDKTQIKELKNYVTTIYDSIPKDIINIRVNVNNGPGKWSIFNSPIIDGKINAEGKEVELNEFLNNQSECVSGQIIIESPNGWVHNSRNDYIEIIEHLNDKVMRHYTKYEGEFHREEGWVTHMNNTFISGHHDASDDNRLCAVLLYFTPHEIEGGELVVGLDERETIKPSFGKGVIIDLGFEDESDSPYHEVLKTTKGHRISTTFFYNKDGF